MRKRFQTVLFYLRLVREDLRVRYSGTFFGVLWAYALPLLTLFVFWFVFQMGFRNEPVIGVPYILWFASAYVPWIFFTDIVTQGGGVFLEYSYLVKKIRFSVSLLPLVKAGTAVFIHLPFLLFLVLLAVWYDYPLPIGFVWIFYYLLLALCLGSILAYLVATITVFFRDMQMVVSILIQIGFWLTPILWDAEHMGNETVGRILSVFPMYYIAHGYRACVLYGKAPDLRSPSALLFILECGVLFLVTVVIYRRLRPYLADEV